MTDQKIRRDRDGFPIETCGRCSGSGHYPSSAWNGVCLGCNGSGVVYPEGKATKLAMQWQRELAQAREVTPAVGYSYEKDGTRTESHGVAPGDVIRQRGSDGGEYRTVTAVRHTALIRGYGMIGVDHWLRGVTLETLITFTDGTTHTSMGEQWDRKVTADVIARRAVLVAQAVKAYATLLKGRETRAVKAAEKRQRQQAERESQVQHLTETHPELAVLIGDKYADANGFMESMRGAVLSGTPTDKQIVAAVGAVKRDAEREREKADLVDAGVTCPTGRLTVEGVVVAVWASENDFGVTRKMRIRTDDGWTAAGTVPNALLRFEERSLNLLDEPEAPEAPAVWLKGCRLQVTATFKPSDRFQLAGWFSRPTGVKVLVDIVKG